MIYGELLGNMIQRSEVICPSSHSQQSAGMKIQNRLLDCKVCVLTDAEYYLNCKEIQIQYPKGGRLNYWSQSFTAL